MTRRRDNDGGERIADGSVGGKRGPTRMGVRVRGEESDVADLGVADGSGDATRFHGGGAWIAIARVLGFWRKELKLKRRVIGIREFCLKRNSGFPFDGSVWRKGFWEVE